ncbi:MAG: Rieske (2Fe-2S) protein [Planctomycetes bacterium]|nr:Rieske (2Fe-2S) protein [Planctomycetota bacterium]
MRTAIWTLEPRLTRGEIDAILSTLHERGLAAESREFEWGWAVVIDAPPDDLVVPPGVARTATADVPTTGVMTRRAVLEAFALGVGVAAVAAACGVAGAFASSTPDAHDTPDEIDVASMPELRATGSKRFSFGREPCIVVLKGDRLHAVSLVCTHLGCLVEWSREGRQFVCPCHRAAFDVEGRVLYGPPPRALTNYDAVVRGDRVVVRRKARA